MDWMLDLRARREAIPIKLATYRIPLPSAAVEKLIFKPAEGIMSEALELHARSHSALDPVFDALIKRPFPEGEEADAICLLTCPRGSDSLQGGGMELGIETPDSSGEARKKERRNAPDHPRGFIERTSQTPSDSRDLVQKQFVALSTPFPLPPASFEALSREIKAVMKAILKLLKEHGRQKHLWRLIREGQIVKGGLLIQSAPRRFSDAPYAEAEKHVNKLREHYLATVHEPTRLNAEAKRRLTVSLG